MPLTKLQSMAFAELQTQLDKIKEINIYFIFMKMRDLMKEKEVSKEIVDSICNEVKPLTEVLLEEKLKAERAAQLYLSALHEEFDN